MAITLEEIKKLSPQKKGLFICLFYIILGALYYVYFLQADLEKRSSLKVKSQELEEQVLKKERLAAEMAKYAKVVDTLRESFKTALTKLPVRREIPELLNNVALSGRNSGIAFLLFEPQPSVRKPIGAKVAPDQKPPGQKAPEQKPQEKKPTDAKAPPAKPEEEDYYEELPVKVEISGGYHNTAVFFEKVAKLPRIINIENVTMGSAKVVKGKGQLLTTACIIKTYMFIQKTGEKDKKPDEKKK